MNKNYIPYSTQYINQSDIRNVNKVLKSKLLTKGKVTLEFENKIKKFCKSKYVVSTINASTALLTACGALGLKKNDIVWTTNVTYIASINCALHYGAKIELCEIDSNSYNISVELLKSQLETAKRKNKLPKIVVIVHLSGNPADLEKINILSKKYKFKIIEDASHAFGSIYNRDPIGKCKFSDMTVFSFHPVKVVTSGEGGAITTNNKKLYEKILMIRENGIRKIKNKIDPNYYDVNELGFNFRINELNASLGISQIKKTKKFIKLKKKLVKRYYQKLNDERIILPKLSKKVLSSWHLFIIRFNRKLIKKKKYDIVKYLHKKGIMVNTHYIPLHKFSFIKKNIKKKSFKISDEYYDSSISIPLFPHMTKSQQDYVIKNIYSSIK